MKKTVLILAVLTTLILFACSPSAPEAQPAETKPAAETTLPPETEAVIETTVPETTAPDNSLEDFSEYYNLLGFSGDERNWITAAIGCVFDDPRDIDLSFMFYLGTEGGSWQDISPESEQYLISQGFMRELDLQVMPAEDINSILQSTFGISLSDVVIPEEWGYLQAEDAYCSNNSDAYVVFPSAITAVTEYEDGTVAVSYTVDSYYNCKTEEFLDHANLVLTLQKTADDSWLVLSNKVTE